MNKQKLLEKALVEFDVWPYGEGAMVYCIKDSEWGGDYIKGEFSDFTGRSDHYLNKENWAFVCTRHEFEAAKAAPQGSLSPELNTKVNTCFGEGIRVSDKISADGIIPIYYPTSNKFSLVHISDIQPIDTRTPEQKLVDTLTTYFEEAMSNEEDYPPISYAKNLLDDIKSGEIEGLCFEDDYS